MITVTVYKNSVNTVDLEMRADGQPVNISGATRMILTIGDTVIDSRNYPAAFDWSSNGVNGQLTLALGQLEPILKLRYATYLSTLAFYDVNYEGLRWGNGFLTKVME